MVHDAEPPDDQKIELRAWREVRAGEEITVDYRPNSLDEWELRCECSAAAQPHTVNGGFLTLPDDLQRAYLPYAPSSGQQAYRRHCAEIE